MKNFFRLNRKATYNLEKDLTDKFAALRIDEHNAELKNNSAGIAFKTGVAHIDPRFNFAYVKIIVLFYNYFILFYSMTVVLY